jgi:hypothetical protein
VGGLLIGVMLMKYLELFGALVCHNPLLDMRRYHLLLAGTRHRGWSFRGFEHRPGRVRTCAVLRVSAVATLLSPGGLQQVWKHRGRFRRSPT